MNNLVFLGEFEGGAIKVYDLGEDFKAIISCNEGFVVKFPELWTTHHKFSYSSNESLDYAIEKAISYNHINSVMTLKKHQYI